MDKIKNYLSTLNYKTIMLLILLIPIGLGLKFYNGPFEFWINNSISDIVYEIFWCLILFLFLPKSSPLKIALLIFIITSIIEFSQLWHPHFLENLRSSFLGRILLGTTFVWSDFFYYVLGCIFGWKIMLYFRASTK